MQDILRIQGGEGIGKALFPGCTVMHQEIRGGIAAAEPPVRTAYQQFLKPEFCSGFLPDQAAIHFQVKRNFVELQPNHRQHGGGGGIAVDHHHIKFLFQPGDHIQAQAFAADGGNSSLQLHPLVGTAALGEPICRAVLLLFVPIVV